jgi:hypothetical protein
VKADLMSAQEPPHGVACCCAEERQRCRLRRDEGKLDALGAMFEAAGGQKRELVERKRPRAGGGHCECDRADIALHGLGQQLAKDGGVGGAAEGECAGERRPGQRPARNHERVVGDLGAVCGASRLRLALDRCELVEREDGAGAVGDRREIEVIDHGDPERLGDRERPVPELRLGREQLEVDQVAGEPA